MVAVVVVAAAAAVAAAVVAAVVVVVIVVAPFLCVWTNLYPAIVNGHGTVGAGLASRVRITHNVLPCLQRLSIRAWRVVG